ncbi:MAG TPA: hypothetical protein VKM55_14270 [Candidatus Lokiarchaeia archaeon]|nr:hypothetical protein [Candidatus Lokiarchaeia archaeon]
MISFGIAAGLQQGFMTFLWIALAFVVIAGVSAVALKLLEAKQVTIA